MTSAASSKTTNKKIEIKKSSEVAGPFGRKMIYHLVYINGEFIQAFGTKRGAETFAKNQEFSK